jgi:tetratricopeptide (TPR) repeat protein
MKKTVLLVLALLFSVSVTSNSQELNKLLEKSDSLAFEYKHEKALDILQKAKENYPESDGVYWRLSRAYVDIAEHMPSETDEQEEAQIETYKKSLDAANKAVELDTTKAVNYLRRAISNGRIALFKGVFSVGDIVAKVRDDCQKAIELGNGGDTVQATAHYVLGRTHAKLSEKWKPARSVLGLGWGNIEDALEHYEKAVNLRDDFTMFYLDYAKANMEEDNYEKARELLKKAIDAPIQDEDDPELKKEAENLLKEIKDE